jgi:pheromone shutdown protein TraB
MNNVEIIGSSHIAKQSITEIHKKIIDQKPEIVCVELDRTRFIGLFQKQKKKVSLKDLRFGGFGAAFMWIGRWLQKKLGDHVGIMPGADMKTAVLAARKVDAKIYLIDIPIQKTLYKLSKEVSLWEKAHLVIHIILSPLSKKNRDVASKIDLTKVPSASLIETMISDLKVKFPKIFKVLLDDRNEFMASQLKKISEKNPDKKIIAVVGAGHEKDLNILLEVKKPTTIKKNRKLLVK